MNATNTIYIVYLFISILLHNTKIYLHRFYRLFDKGYFIIGKSIFRV